MYVKDENRLKALVEMTPFVISDHGTEFLMSADRLMEHDSLTIFEENFIVNFKKICGSDVMGGKSSVM